MTRFPRPIIAAHIFAAWGLLFALPQVAHAISLIRVSDPSLCVDGMETDPDSDELAPMLAGVDGGCMIQTQDIISI